MKKERVILASASPRRRDLLFRVTPEFEVVASDAEELTQGEGRWLAEQNALIKARDVAAQYKGRSVLSADTVVVIDGMILGKPKDRSDAKDMLRLLSGREHTVYTAMCLIAKDGRELTAVSETKVKMTELSEYDIATYVHTGEPLDKAGAYALQGVGGQFVEGIVGSPTGVMGLSLFETKQLLKQGGLL